MEEMKKGLKSRGVRKGAGWGPDHTGKEFDLYPNSNGKALNIFR